MPTRVELGLKSLDLRPDTNSSPFHRWAVALPHGHVCALRSVLPASDHLLLLGLTKNLIGATYAVVSEPKRVVAEACLRDSLRES